MFLAMSVIARVEGRFTPDLIIKRFHDLLARMTETRDK